MKSKSIITVIIVAIIVIIIGGGVYALTHRDSTTDNSAKGDALIIKNSGSTNTSGWNLTIKADGSGTLAEGGSDAGTFKTGTFDMDTFRADLKKIGGIDTLQPSGQLMKSVSFGTNEHATYQGKTSGDLNESYEKSSSDMKALHTLLMKFVSESQATNKPRHQVHPLSK